MINCMISKHVSAERRNRMEYIYNTVGFGDVVVAEMPDLLHDGTLLQLTDTGVILARSLTSANNLLITAFIATTAQAVAIYKTAHNGASMPKHLYKTLTRVQKFMENQPKC